jgi:plasmid stability protein
VLLLFDISEIICALVVDWSNAVAQFLVRNLDKDVKAALQRRARAHGCSMEEEVRRILRLAVQERPEPGKGLGSRMSARFDDVGLEGPLPQLHGQQIDPVSLDP